MSLQEDDVSRSAANAGDYLKSRYYADGLDAVTYVRFFTAADRD